VVGAGLAGLAASAVLASRARTSLVERLPATGGFAGWDAPEVTDLDREGRRAGVVQLLGATALRWENGRLLVAAPGSIRWIVADRLVVATGSRPATAADLRLAGDRPVGVFAATVAEHLVGAGVTLGRTTVIVGVSYWSARLAHVLRERHQPVRVLGLAGDRRPDWADEWLGTGTPRVIHGRPRLESVEIIRPDGLRERLGCDALVIAGPAMPIRNVDGAVRPSPGLTFIHAADLGSSDRDIVTMSRSIAAAIDVAPGRSSQ
jgi:hypothetical protein